MTGIASYFTSIVATAIIGVILCSIITDQRIGNLMKTVIGILVLMVVLRPLLRIDPEELSGRIMDTIDKEQFTDEYEALYEENLKKQIISTTESYIIREASSMGADIRVEVELSEEPYPVPRRVTVTGKLTPEQKAQLQDYLTHQLGIDPRNQRWNVYD